MRKKVEKWLKAYRKEYERFGTPQNATQKAVFDMLLHKILLLEQLLEDD